MIDIHAHILPGLDDGPATLEDSLEMASIAAEKGTRTIVATPHSLNGVYYNSRNDILPVCDEFNNVLQQYNIPLKVLPGSEVRFCVEILDEIENGRLMTLNDTGRYLSLELPDHILPNQVTGFIKKLMSRNIVPVIAHPERNMAIQYNVDLVAGFVSAGALCQITGGSLTGAFGPEALSCCKKMISQGLAHFMASDAHSPSGRTPNLKKSFKKLASAMGKEKAEQIMVTAPKNIIGGVV